MDDFINRRKLIEEYDRQHKGPAGGARKLMEEAPAADVVEVKHGKWELGKSGCSYFCSSCELWAFPREAEQWKFCPNCGAKMDGERKGE